MAWARSLKGIKVNNHAGSRKTKIDLRKIVLGAINDACVLDAFAGSGRMFHDVWAQAKSYTACDTEWYKDGRLAYVCDNRRLLRSIDLQRFNVFDFDAYGSPWEQVLILTARRKVASGERIGIVLTDGSSMNLRLNGMPTALKQISGFSSVVAGAGSTALHAEIIDRAITRMAKLMNCQIISRHEATGKTAARVKYIALVMQGL